LVSKIFKIELTFENPFCLLFLGFLVESG